MTDAADYLFDFVRTDEMMCGCDEIARIDVERVKVSGEQLTLNMNLVENKPIDVELQFLYVCNRGFCKRKFSLLDYVVLTKYGVRCVCRLVCKINDAGIYECPSGIDGCGFACHRLDSVTFAQIKIAEERGLEGAFYLSRKAKEVCSKPGTLKFQYDIAYTQGTLVYKCVDKDCSQIVITYY
jgi:hypothetical protein